MHIFYYVQAILESGTVYNSISIAYVCLNIVNIVKQCNNVIMISIVGPGFEWYIILKPGFYFNP